LSASERVFALIDAEPVVTQTADEPVERLRGEITFEHVRFRYSDGARDEPEIRRHETRDTELDGGGSMPGGTDGAPLQEDAPPVADARAVELQQEPLAAIIGDRQDRQQSDFPSSLPAPRPPHPYVLPDFNLHILAGETLAVVGHTGAGKSSLARLLARFYEFQGGRILIDGRDIRTFDLQSYRRQIGIVPQVPFLFRGSVADNIRYGRPDAANADVARAAQQIGGGEWVEQLEAGLDTDVGERGSSLSMGQRQLVALARVLLHDPAILILDEATASVDPFTELQIQEGLDVVMAGRTSIVIAHRLSTVRNADRIIVLRAGEIIEQGNHRSLLAQGGHYAELYNTYFRHQSLSYIEQVGQL
jgi:ABC-type multidrug transport system fused ATPase/permease subunit